MPLLRDAPPELCLPPMAVWQALQAQQPPPPPGEVFSLGYLAPSWLFVPAGSPEYEQISHDRTIVFNFKGGKKRVVRVIYHGRIPLNGQTYHVYMLA